MHRAATVGIGVSLVLLLSAFPAATDLRAAENVPSNSPSRHPWPRPRVGGNVGFATEVIPQHPCLGDRVQVIGTNYHGATRAAVWISRGGGNFSQRVERDDIYHLPGGVKVAEAEVDENGHFETSFVLHARLGPADGGGSIVLEPGAHYYVAMKSNADGGGGPSIGLMVPESGCPSSSESLPPPLRVTLSPQYPCPGRVATLSGSGFEGPNAHVSMGEMYHRFGSGNYKALDVPVGPDGTWRINFDPGEYFRDPEGYNVIWASDPSTHRSASVPAPVCNKSLERALTARSVAFLHTFYGTMDPDSQSRMTVITHKRVFKTFVLHHPADLRAAAIELGFSPELFAELPSLDYDRETGLMVCDQWSGVPGNIEIAGVESGATGLTAYPVRWYSLEPGDNRWYFHLVGIARTDRPITFASPAAAPGLYRDALRPSALPERIHPQSYWRNGPQYFDLTLPSPAPRRSPPPN